MSATGDQVRFRTRKHFAVFIRLALAGGHRCSREELMEMLWPQVSSKLARHSLAQAITVIKSRVGRDRIAAARNAVALTAGTVDVDALAIEDGRVEVSGAFLDGFDIPGARGFDQWKDEWTSKLLPRIRDCLVRQMDAGRRVGDFAAVERRATMLLQFDPLSEDGVRGVMESRAWVGDRSSALKAYDAYVAQLAEVLDARPSPDIARMADLLREGHHPGRPRGVAERAERAGRRERRMEAETIIGRTREFSLLYDCWLDAKKGTPRVVVVTGDPGVGKTTLTNAFLSSCQLEGSVVARVQAYDAERELPFAVLSELVRQLALQRTIGGADPEALAELSRVCADVGTAFPGVPRPPDWAAEVIPIRLADALLKSLTAAAEESPVVLVVDDVHASDNSSAAILHMLARKMTRARFMLILVGRPTELRIAGAGALVGDASIGGMGTVELDALGAEAARELVTRLVEPSGHRDPPVDRILEAGRGNALALELLAREWVDHGPDSLLRDLEAINTTPAPRIGIPPAVRTVCEREVRRLDPGVRSALDFAAVLGRRLHEVELYQVTGLAPVAASNALARLMEEGFLRDVQGVLEFRNELIRAHAYYAIPSTGREHLHRAAGEALSRLPEPACQGATLEIAWHFLRARDAERAMAFALDGAERCLARGAPSEAEQVLTAIARECPARSHRQSMLTAQALLDQSKAEDATPHLDALRGATGAGIGTARVAAMRATAEFLLARETGVKHSAAAEEAVETALKEGDPGLAARSLYLLARTHGETGNTAGMRRVRETLTQLKQRPEYRRVPMMLFTEGYCEFMTGSAEEAAALVERAEALLDPAERSTEQLPIMNGVATCRYHAGDVRGACETYVRAYGLALSRGDDAWACMIAANLCTGLAQVGDSGSAIRYGEDSVALAGRVLRQPRATLSFANLASAYLLAGDSRQAEASLARAAALVDEHSNWEPRILFYQESACIALSLGHVDTALRHIESLDDIVGLNTSPPNAGVCERLRIFRAFFTQGAEKAMESGQAAVARFRGKSVVFYLDAVAARAFVERRVAGVHSPETTKALELFESLGLKGKRWFLTSQGFLV